MSDQCQRCAARGSLDACDQTECHRHEDWIVKTLRDRIKSEALRAPANEGGGQLMAENKWPESRLRLLAAACGWEWIEDGEEAGYPHVVVAKYMQAGGAPPVYADELITGWDADPIPFDPSADNGRLLFEVLKAVKARGEDASVELCDEGYLAFVELDINHFAEATAPDSPTLALCEAVVAAAGEEEKE